MSKRANTVGGRKTTLLVLKHQLGKSLLAGAAIAGPLFLAQAAQAQQAYYYPQAGSSSSVSVNYGALTPYGAPAQPGAFQPYGYVPNARVSSSPKSVFTPAGVPAYGAPAAAYGQPVYGYGALPSNAPFVAPYANPAFAPGFVAAGGLPLSTPTANGAAPQSYLNVPGGAGAQPVALKAPGEASTTKKKKKKKAAAPAALPAATPTATEEGAAAQVAAAEAALESGPAPAATTPAATAAPAAEPAPVEPTPEPAAAAEPVPAPTPPAEPTEVPASVPSPAANTTASVAAAPAATPEVEAPAAPAADAASADAPAAEAPSVEAPAADQQVASAEAPAETAPDTSGSAVLPAGGTRIVFDGAADELPQGATGDLDAIAAKMLEDQNIKVQVLAYSSGTPDAESQARRKALARGLEVRKYLIGKGVRSNRIDVRALGTKSEGNPADRVDIVPSAS